jgi:hypothetical protein
MKLFFSKIIKRKQYKLNQSYYVVAEATFRGYYLDEDREMWVAY